MFSIQELEPEKGKWVGRALRTFQRDLQIGLRGKKKILCWREQHTGSGLDPTKESQQAMVKATILLAGTALIGYNCSLIYSLPPVSLTTDAI